MLPNTLDFLFEKINCCFFQYVQIQQIFWGQKVNLISAVSRQLSWAHFHSGNLKSGPKSCIKAFISGLKSADAWNRKSRIKPSNEIFVKDSWNFGGIWIHIPLRHWKNIAGTFWIFFRRSDFWFLPWQMVDPKRSNQHPDSKSVRLTGYICYHFSSGNTDPNSILKKIYKIQRFPKKTHRIASDGKSHVGFRLEARTLNCLLASSSLFPPWLFPWLASPRKRTHDGIYGMGFEGTGICFLGWKRIHQRLPNIFQDQSCCTSKGLQYLFRR